jgi:hypothetical protein
VIQFHIPNPAKLSSTMKKTAVKEARIRYRPAELAVDYLVSAHPTFVERELAFLSNDVEKEFEGVEYVVVSPVFTENKGWRVLKVGKWEGQPTLEGRKVVISGVDESFRKSHVGHVLVQRVSPPPLDTVVLKVSELDYDTIAEDQESFERLQREGVVFRSGKVLDAGGFQVEVALCEPVRQGIIGDETEIILVTDAEEKRAMVNGIGTPFSFASQNESDLDILQFLSLPSSEEDVDGIVQSIDATSTPPADEAVTRGIPLKAVVLQRPVDKYSLDPRPADSEDPEFRVYAHMRDIARIGVFSGDWVSPTIYLD